MSESNGPWKRFLLKSNTRISSDSKCGKVPVRSFPCTSNISRFGNCNTDLGIGPCIRLCDRLTNRKDVNLPKDDGNDGLILYVAGDALLFEFATLLVLVMFF